MISRIENKVDTGWPDTFYTHNKKSGWIELKSEKTFPKRIDFEPAQPNWLTDYHKIGGTCYVFLHVEEENSIYIWTGADARKLNEATQGIKPLMKVKADQEGIDALYIKLFI